MKSLIITFLLISLIVSCKSLKNNSSNEQQKYNTNDASDSSKYYSDMLYEVFKTSIQNCPNNHDFQIDCLSPSVLKEVKNLMMNAGKLLALEHGKPTSVNNAKKIIADFTCKLGKYTWDLKRNRNMPLEPSKFNEFEMSLCPLWPICK